MLITTRDRAIVEWVHEVGVSTREQIQRLFFTEGGRSRCQRRLTLLFRNRFLDRLPNRYPNVPDVYCISRKSTCGLRLLRALGEPPRVAQGNRALIQHTLDIVDCRVQIMRACSASGLSLVRWLNEEELRFTTARDGILPDAYFQLARSAAGEQDKRSGFFVEVERSGKTDRTLTDKFRRYGAFYYGGGFEKQFGLRALRVLVLVGSDYGVRPEAQIGRIAALAQTLGVTFLRSATLFDFVTADPSNVLFKPIWRKPGQSVPVTLFEDRPEPSNDPRSNGD